VIQDFDQQWKRSRQNDQFAAIKAYRDEREAKMIFRSAAVHVAGGLDIDVDRHKA
jgi:hypothetical protein